MNRKRATAHCPDCSETAVVDDNGRMKCRCADKAWEARKSEKGTDEECAFLANAGFEVTTDIQGDVYYVGPVGHIVWLYSGGEWCADKAPSHCTSLDEYVSGVKAALDSSVTK